MSILTGLLLFAIALLAVFAAEAAPALQRLRVEYMELFVMGAKTAGQARNSGHAERAGRTGGDWAGKTSEGLHTSLGWRA